MTTWARFLSGTLAAFLAFAWPQPNPLSHASAAASAPPMRSTVRVGMWTLWRDREIKVTSATADHIVKLKTGSNCTPLLFAGSVDVRAGGTSVQLAGAGRTGETARVDFANGITLTAHGESVTLRHPVTITARSGILITTVTLPVENYVERVVSSESGSADSQESLKALAVVVRSFALHERHGHADFDLCDSTHCQLLHWSGNGSRQNAAHAAALATSGETLWFRGQRALAYFNKDCGGRAASIAEIWPRAHSVPYLASQADRYCAPNSGHDWASQISHADLATALATHGIVRHGWQRLAIARRGESGRVVSLRLDTSEVNAEDFRIAVGESLGWNQIPSTWFEVNQQGDRFYFHGRGWGHGVGLCQRGAAAMAAQNRTATEILAQYFPGANAADELSGRGWQSFARSGFVLESLDASDAAYVSALERAHAEAVQRSGLNEPQVLTVRAFGSTPAFRNATGAPGWTAAFTENDWIGMQPLRTLAARHLLDSIARHEFLHALVEHQAGSAAPLWLREGLVEVWAEPETKTAVASSIGVDALDSVLAHATSEAQSAAAHRAAAGYASRLLARYGRERVLEWLRSGVPASIVATLGQR